MSKYTGRPTESLGDIRTMLAEQIADTVAGGAEPSPTAVEDHAAITAELDARRSEMDAWLAQFQAAAAEGRGAEFLANS